MRKPIVAIALLAVLAAACGPAGIGVRGGRPEGLAFITQVVDITDDSGDGVSLTTDADGNPHLAYLSFLPDPVEGEPPPAVDPLGVLVPAVKHAHFVNDTWTRTVVRDTPIEVEEGEEPPPEIAPDDDTDIVLDGDGVHHIVFTASGGLFYSNNAEGAFSPPQEISGGPATAPSITAADDGTLWVAFYEDVEGAEGPGSLVRAATLAGKEPAWLVETAAEAAPDDPRGTGIGVAGGQPHVAYNSDGRVLLASRTASGQWESQAIDDGAGPSLAVDPDGNPHVAYYAGGGVSHAHSIESAPWDISEVTGSAEPDAESPASIALDEAGIHHVAWHTGEGIGYANNEGGQFEEEDVPGSAGGVQPAIGAGAEGVASIAWYQPKEELLKLSIRSEEEPLLAVPVEEPVVGPGGTPGAECEPDGTELAIGAPPGAAVNGFDKDCLAAPVGEAFTIEFDNQDEPQQHNVAIYTEQGGDALFNGDIFAAPETRTYDVDPLEEGTLFFQCDVHPTTMTGTFVVA